MPTTYEELEKALRQESGETVSNDAKTDTVAADEEEETDTESESADAESKDDSEEQSDDESEEEDDESEGDSDEAEDTDESDESEAEDDDASKKDVSEDPNGKKQEPAKKEEDATESEEVKNIRRKLLSQVSQKDKIADKALSLAAEAMSKNGKHVTVDSVKALVSAEIAKEDARRALAKEERKFFGTHPDASKYRDEIKAVKAQFDSISWDAARKLVLAERDPSALIKSISSKKDALPSSATAKKEAPKETDPNKMSRKELDKAAELELRRALGQA